MTATQAERDAMRRALALALNGPRGVNPQVGAVILSPAGEVLADGWHRGAGTAHAEVDALSKLAPGAARGATAVVTLEPCNHHGRTGPCAQALIEAGIARVVYAVDDPGVKSSGGAEHLRAAGVDVEPGLLADEGAALLDGWLTVQRLDRPHVTVKWAQSLDGRAAASDGTSQWITGAEARADVHRRRAARRCDRRRHRHRAGGRPRAHRTRRRRRRSCRTSRSRSSSGARAVPADAAAAAASAPPPAVRRHGSARGARPTCASAACSASSSKAAPPLASAFVRAGLVDEVLAYVAPVLLGGDRLALGDLGIGTIGDARRLAVASVERLGDDLLIVAHPIEGTR